MVTQADMRGEGRYMSLYDLAEAMMMEDFEQRERDAERERRQDADAGARSDAMLRTWGAR